MRALCAGVVGGRREEVGLEEASVGRQSRDMMTWLVMALNCVMVARMVGDMFSFLSLCDHTQPRHWYGTTLTNRAWNATATNQPSVINVKQQRRGNAEHETCIISRTESIRVSCSAMAAGVKSMTPP